MLSNYQKAMTANRDGLLETIEQLDKEIGKVDRAISDFETTKECLLKARAAMLAHVRTYEAEIAKG